MGKPAASKAKRRAPRMRVDLSRLLPVAGITLLLVFALFCAWQAWLIAREKSVIAEMNKLQQQVLQILVTTVKVDRDRIIQAMSDENLVATLESDSAAARSNALAIAYDLLPKAQLIEFYSPGMAEVVKADYGVFGYSKAAQLMGVQSNQSEPLLETVSRKHQRRLSMALPVRAGKGKVVAYAWVELPFKPLQLRFDTIDPGAGRLELRQGDGSDDLLLVANGSTQAQLPPFGVAGLAVPGSTFWVVTARPRAFVVLPHSWLLAVLLSALSFAGLGALLWWWRRRNRVPATAAAALAMAADAQATELPVAVPLPAPKAAAARVGAVKPPLEIDQSIFRAYDIRGVVGTQLTTDVAMRLGRAIGSVMREQKLTEMVLGRDGRLSGPDLSKALGEGLSAAGIDVIDIGAVPTPLVYFGAFHYNTGCGVAVTGSHNPPEYNGFKIVIGGETLSEGAIQDLYRRITEDAPVDEARGVVRQMDLMTDYIERIAGDVQVERPLRVVIDAGNGIAGAVAPQVLAAIGCRVEPLHCDVDGNFPNHHPDPSDPENLHDLILVVKKTGADLGVAFDGDGDRLGVVTREGKIINPDRVLMLFARDVLARDPGATIIYDVKCTGHIGPDILRHGGSPLMWRTGHSLIKAKMRETGSALAGEMSGHFFFRDRWYGFDDGIYSAARLLEIIADDIDGRDADAIFATLPDSVSTPELKVSLQEGENHEFIERFCAQARFDGARLTTIDGLRADWPDGWGLVRASNTTPVLVLRFEADNIEALKNIKQMFRTQMLAVNASLVLPF